ncbi:cytochrome b [Lichenicoccus roseus]|nr:cytochrome b/b6 domain-containing protein [Lichenicoccus roseus]
MSDFTRNGFNGRVQPSLLERGEVVREPFAPVQRVLHWAMAVCILAMLFIGVGMVSTARPISLGLVDVHRPLGILILLLVVVRLAVRARRGTPALPRDLPAGVKLGATLSHWLLYAAMISMPIIGWGMVSAAGLPVVMWGGFQLPPILPHSDALHAVLWDAHRIIAYLLFALILLHVSAALMHALIRRDGVFEAMAGGRPPV